MNYEQAKNMAEKQIADDETLIGMLQVSYIPSYLWLLVVGPLFFIRTRQYILNITDKYIYFNCLSMFGDNVDMTDKFNYDEISKLSLKGRGSSNRKLDFLFYNGRKIQLTVFKLDKKTHKKIQNDSRKQTLKILVLTDEIIEFLKSKGAKC